jgi:hypothetical protein
MSDTALTVAQLTTALDRCMVAHPPTGLDFALHCDANRMADLWGLMVLRRIDQVALSEVPPAVIDAYTRWMAP